MSPSELFQLVIEDGHRLELNASADGFHLRGDGNPSPALVKLLHRHRDGVLALLRAGQDGDAAIWALVEEAARLFPGATVTQAGAVLDAWVNEHRPDLVGEDRWDLDLLLRSRLIGATKSKEPVPIELFENYQMEEKVNG
jgi:hypothetical protein